MVVVGGGLSALVTDGSDISDFLVVFLPAWSILVKTEMTSLDFLQSP